MTTFYDGNVLSASQLNDLVQAVNALIDGAVGVNLGFAEVTIPGNNNSIYYQVRHKYDNLYLDFTDGGQTPLLIYYGGTLVYTSNDSGAPQTANVDLSGFGLTKGALYRVRLRSGGNKPDESITVRYMVESSEAL